MSVEVVVLPKDRNGQTLHIGDEVFVFNGTEPVAQGEVMDMTLVWFEPVTWYVDLYKGPVGCKRYRTRVSCFGPHELERIEVGSDGSD